MTPFRLLAACVLVAVPTAAIAQGPAIRPDALRRHLYTIAADSMGGRGTGERGNWLAAEYVAAEFRRLGLRPAGDNGTFFQTLPFSQLAPDTSLRLRTDEASLTPGRDLIPVGPPMVWRADGVRAMYGGVVTDTSTWAVAGRAQGMLVVLVAPSALDVRQTFARFLAATRHPRFAGAAGFAIATDALADDLADQIMQGQIVPDSAAAVPAPGRPLLLLRGAGAALVLGADPATLAAGAVGPVLTGGAGMALRRLRFAVRNVVAVLPGGDRARARTYVSLTAHNDHVGFTRAPVDHDSARVTNQVLRPLGADTPLRPATPEEAARIASLREDLRAVRPPRPDSVFNGADDDGSGTVALLEVARSLAQGPRLRRSVLFVSHAAEERGLLGSRWFTDHPTVARDSIVAEIDMDMIGRGNADDLPDGGPGYLEVIGSRRVSREFGDLLEAANARLPRPFTFNYEFDAPGHPLQYYCRADHYSYARYGIPAVALSRGEHRDYHQVTDEPQYIDYDVIARVATLARDAARSVADLDHRPLVDAPPGDPHAPCRQ